MALSTVRRTSGFYKLCRKHTKRINMRFHLPCSYLYCVLKSFPQVSSSRDLLTCPKEKNKSKGVCPKALSSSGFWPRLRFSSVVSNAALVLLPGAAGPPRPPAGPPSQKSQLKDVELA